MKRKPKAGATPEQKFQAEANKKRMEEIVSSLEKTKEQSLQIVSLDPKVYDEVMDCYRSGAAPEKLEDALENAFRLQADLALIIVMAKEWNAHMKEIVKGAVANDLIVSDQLLGAAFEGAYHTAYINTVYMKNPERKSRADNALMELRNRYEARGEKEPPPVSVNPA